MAPVSPFAPVISCSTGSSADSSSSCPSLSMSSGSPQSDYYLNSPFGRSRSSLNAFEDTTKNMASSESSFPWSRPQTSGPAAYQALYTPPPAEGLSRPRSSDIARIWAKEKLRDVEVVLYGAVSFWMNDVVDVAKARTHLSARASVIDVAFLLSHLDESRR